MSHTDSTQAYRYVVGGCDEGQLNGVYVRCDDGRYKLRSAPDTYLQQLNGRWTLTQRNTAIYTAMNSGSLPTQSAWLHTGRRTVAQVRVKSASATHVNPYHKLAMDSSVHMSAPYLPPSARYFANAALPRTDGRVLDEPLPSPTIKTGPRLEPSVVLPRAPSAFDDMSTHTARGRAALVDGRERRPGYRGESAPPPGVIYGSSEAPPPPRKLTITSVAQRTDGAELHSSTAPLSATAYQCVYTSPNPHVLNERRVLPSQGAAGGSSLYSVCSIYDLAGRTGGAGERWTIKRKVAEPCSKGTSEVEGGQTEDKTSSSMDGEACHSMEDGSSVSQVGAKAEGPVVQSQGRPTPEALAADKAREERRREFEDLQRKEREAAETLSRVRAEMERVRLEEALRERAERVKLMGEARQKRERETAKARERAEREVSEARERVERSARARQQGEREADIIRERVEGYERARLEEEARQKRDREAAAEATERERAERVERARLQEETRQQREREAAAEARARERAERAERARLEEEARQQTERETAEARQRAERARQQREREAAEVRERAERAERARLEEEARQKRDREAAAEARARERAERARLEEEARVMREREAAAEARARERAERAERARLEEEARKKREREAAEVREMERERAERARLEEGARQKREREAAEARERAEWAERSRLEEEAPQKRGKEAADTKGPVKGEAATSCAAQQDFSYSHVHLGHIISQPHHETLQLEFKSAWSDFDSFAYDVVDCLAAYDPNGNVMKVFAHNVMLPLYRATQGYVDRTLAQSRAQLVQLHGPEASFADDDYGSTARKFWAMTQRSKLSDEVAALTDSQVQAIIKDADSQKPGDVVAAGIVGLARELLEEGVRAGKYAKLLTVELVVRNFLRLHLLAQLSDPRCYLHPAPGTRLRFVDGHCAEVLSPGVRRYGRIKEGDLVEVVLPGLYFDGPNKTSDARPVALMLVRRLTVDADRTAAQEEHTNDPVLPNPPAVLHAPAPINAIELVKDGTEEWRNDPVMPNTSSSAPPPPPPRRPRRG